MNSNKSEIYGLTGPQLHMYAVKIPEQVHVYIFQYYIKKSNNRLENLDCSNMITVLVGCQIYTLNLIFHQ